LLTEALAVVLYHYVLGRKGTKGAAIKALQPFTRVSLLLPGISDNPVEATFVAWGPASDVVVIFDDDGRDDKYPYKMTWLGEHEQESDMAFYATPPEDNIVGPGICRCEYGGFLMTYPPRRLLDVWQDPDYWFLKQKSEVLLTAALDYSLERCVVYVAAQPPKSYMRTIAERLQRQIAYVPLASLSPSRLMKIRVFHILNGYDKRDVAKDFIV